VNYLLKWLLLGAIIGVGAGLAAIAFHRAIELVTTWTLGDFSRLQTSSATGRRARYYLHHCAQMGYSLSRHWAGCWQDL